MGNTPELDERMNDWADRSGIECVSGPKHSWQEAVWDIVPLADDEDVISVQAKCRRCSYTVKRMVTKGTARMLGITLDDTRRL